MSEKVLLERDRPLAKVIPINARAKMVNGLNKYTTVHEMHEFTYDDLETAFHKQLKRFDGPRCAADHCCRLWVFDSEVCYLHNKLGSKPLRKVW